MFFYLNLIFYAFFNSLLSMSFELLLLLLEASLDDELVLLPLASLYYEVYDFCGFRKQITSITSGVNKLLPFSFKFFNGKPGFYLLSFSLKLLSSFMICTSLKIFTQSYSVFAWFSMNLSATFYPVIRHSPLYTQP